LRILLSLSLSLSLSRKKRTLSIISKFWKRGANFTEITWWSLRKLNCRSREYRSPIGVSIDCIGCHESGYDRKRGKWRTKLARRAAIEKEEPITVQFMKRKIKFCWSELTEWHRNVSYVRNIHTYKPWLFFGNWPDASEIKQFLEWERRRNIPDKSKPVESQSSYFSTAMNISSIKCFEI